MFCDDFCVKYYLHNLNFLFWWFLECGSLYVYPELEKSKKIIKKTTTLCNQDYHTLRWYGWESIDCVDNFRNKNHFKISILHKNIHIWINSIFFHQNCKKINEKKHKILIFWKMYLLVTLWEMYIFEWFLF